MTIGIFMEHYEPFVSGVVTSVNGLVAELESRGHMVYIICPAVKGHVDTNPRVIRIPSVTTRFFDNATLGLPSRRIMKLLMDIDFDVVHSQDIYYTSATGLKLARMKNIPYIQTFHTLWHRYLEQNKVNPFFKFAAAGAMILSYPQYLGLGESGKFIKEFITSKPHRLSHLLWLHMLNMSEKADEVIVPSAHLRDEILQDRPGVYIHSVPNAVVPYENSRRNLLPKRSANRIRIASVARFSPEKRLDIIVKAFARLPSQYELIMIGEGPDLRKIKERANDLGCRDRISFVGNRDNVDVRHILRECDIFAIASHDFDNQPMVIVEAIDAGLPVVYCDSRFKEGLNNRNSILVSQQAPGFTKAFNALSDESKRMAMSKASKTLAKDYAIQGTTQKVLDLYYDAITGKKDAKKTYLIETAQKS